jgi:hypothetical protein
MKASFHESDFERAVNVVAGGVSPSALAERLGVEWDYLAWLAIGVAEEVLAELGEHDRAVANGAEAFTCGFLIGAYLPWNPARKRRGSMLPWAVERVRQRGRHAVIADYCDLAVVARVETIYAEALVETLGVKREEQILLELPVTRLFESGLATGLVLGDL